MPIKTPTAAVVILPPEDLWEPIQRIRRRYDKKIDRWMPHINLLYPFYPRLAFEEAAPALAEACASQAPFEVTLARFGHFAHGRDRYTMWLAPEPERPLVEIQAVLQTRFPDCDEVSRFEEGFRPHLSVGQALGERVLEACLREIGSGWAPLRFKVAEIALIAREETTPYRIERRIPLGKKS